MTPTWRGIYRRLGQELHRLFRGGGDAWHEFQNTRLPAEAVAQDWALADRPHLAELRAALDAWTSDGEWPEMSDGARYCLRMRLDAAERFVFLLTDREYIPVPHEQSEREIVRWFLLEWWPIAGREYFAREISVPPGSVAEE